MAKRTTSTTPRKATKSAADSAQPIQWTYEIGPPRRTLRWYLSVIGIGAFISLVLYAGSGGNWNATGWGIFWVLIVLTVSIAPSRARIVTLERDLLTLRDARHDRGKVEQNLREFAAYDVTLIAEDRVNPEQYTIELLQRTGKPSVQFTLPEDAALRARFLERIEDVVPPAPDVAPSLIKRFVTFAERWIGWR